MRILKALIHFQLTKNHKFEKKKAPLLRPHAKGKGVFHSEALIKRAAPTIFQFAQLHFIFSKLGCARILAIVGTLFDRKYTCGFLNRISAYCGLLASSFPPFAPHTWILLGYFHHFFFFNLPAPSPTHPNIRGKPAALFLEAHWHFGKNFF